MFSEIFEWMMNRRLLSVYFETMDQYIVRYLSDRSLLIWVFGHVQRRINLYGVRKKPFFISVMNLNLIIDRLFVSTTFFNDYKFYVLNCYEGWCHFKFRCKNVNQIWNRFQKSKKVKNPTLLRVYRYSISRKLKVQQFYPFIHEMFIL